MKIKKSSELKMVDIHDIRNINQTLLLHLIREKQPISRAEIAKVSGLRPGTVSSIVNRLMRKGVIYEGAEGPSSGGRKPTYLYINGENAYVLAIDIGVRDTVYAISDFNGRILKQKAIITEGKPRDFLQRLAAEIKKTIEKSYPRTKFKAVGVSVPGLIKRDTGEVAVSPNLEWNNTPVKAILEEKLNLPVFVENDANAAAFSELWYGPLDEIKVKTLLYILVVDGLGTGLIINGELHVGSQISADGAYDRKKVYQAIEQRKIKRAAIPPRKGAKIWRHGNTPGERLIRDENLRSIRRVGKPKWKRESDYHRRSLAETGVFRFKTIFTDKLQSRKQENQFQEMIIKCAALNRMTHLGMPASYKVVD